MRNLIILSLIAIHTQANELSLGTLSFDNSNLNWDNSELSYDNSPLNYENSRLNRNGTVIVNPRGEAIGYTRPRSDGGLNIYSLDGNLESYQP